MEDPTDPIVRVPKDAIVIAATYNAKTGDVKHSLLARDDLDPKLLRQILCNAATMKVTHKKFAKLRLPPRREGDPVRSFRSRIIVRATAAISDLPQEVVRQLVPAVVGYFYEKMIAAVDTRSFYGTDGDPLTHAPPFRLGQSGGGDA